MKEICVCVCMCVYLSIYVEREGERGKLQISEENYTPIAQKLMNDINNSQNTWPGKI